MKMQLGPFTFGYNAIEDKGRRQSPQTRVKHESEVLTPYKRRKLQATAQEQMRNHSLVAWMVRKHLDYVSKFHFNFRTNTPSVDTLVERIFRWHGRPENIDYMRKFGRDELFRFFELEKVVCGDAGLLKLPTIKLQAIESDLIAKGANSPTKVKDGGVVVDSMGRVTDYAICTRGTDGATPTFDHLEAVENLIFDAYWSRFSSQHRGVSPLASAINMVQDVHEAFEFNIVKAKMHALFGVAIMREAEGTPNFGGAAGTDKEVTGATVGADGSELDIDPRTINMLDLNPGEDVKIIESGTPSNEFVEGSYLFIQVAMLALDIPVTCFDSRRSSFSARIADLNEYEVSAEYKRNKNKYVRQAYSDWVLDEIWNDPASVWPLRSVAGAVGMSLRDVQESVEWVPHGSPWLDKYQQIKGDQLGIDIGLDNVIDACRRRGTDFFDNMDKQKIALEYAKNAGVPLVVGGASDKTITDIVRQEIEIEKAANETEE